MLIFQCPDTQELIAVERLEDNIHKWTDLKFGKFQRAVKNRDNGVKSGCNVMCGAQMKLVVKGLMMNINISVCKQRWRQLECSSTLTL